MVLLTRQTLVRAVLPPYTYGPELVAQVRITLTIAFLPLVLVAFALSFGPAGVQASDFFGLFGAFDRMGSAWQIAVTRLFAPLTTAIVLAGVVGTSICADLGARVVREEIDALRVLGVDPVKSLVVPRFMVLTGAAFMFNAFAMLAGMLGAVLVLIQHGQPVGPFFHEYFAAANLTEVGADFAQAGIYGGVIAVVSCYNGMTVSGGAEGVGRAVNKTVVVCFLAVAVISYVFEAFVLATHPVLSIPRG
jgi:phospholipid/cholesterol/gamma-HCH transport system permease protein